MKIGERIYVRGYVDDISEDGESVIVRNDGGYFETINSEIVEVGNNAKGANIRHGRWKIPEGHGEARVCSECGMICHADRAMVYNYCPNCGAAMMGEEV